MRLVRALHPPPGHDDAGDGVAAAGGLLRLSPAADRRHSPHRGAHHHGERAVSRRQPRYHGGVGGSPARAAVRHHRRHHARSPRSAPRAARRSRWSSTSTATSMLPRSTCSRRSRWRQRACPMDLPAPPAYRKVNPADTPVIFLALTSDTAQSQEMNEFADKVMSPKLSTLPGVAQVNIQGAQKRAVRIRYDLDALATRGISVEEIRQAVPRCPRWRRSAASAPSSSSTSSRSRAREPYADYFKPAVVAWRNGAPVRLQDIAKVDDFGRGRGGADRVQRQALDHRFGAAPARRQYGCRHRRHPRMRCPSSTGCCRRPSSSTS